MLIETMFGLLMQGLQFSLEIFAVTMIGSLPLGIIIALLRMNKWTPIKSLPWFKPIQMIASLYISLMRGTPLMLQLMLWMFGPYYIFHITMGSDWKYTACFIGFILNYAAYFGEIYRSGIQSIPQGQYEAAQVLGYTRFQTFMLIVLPQVIKRIIPAMSNEIITLVKDTSLAFVLGISEMFSVAKQIAAGQVSMFPYVIAAGIYWVFCLLIELIMNKVEDKLGYYHD